MRKFLIVGCGGSGGETLRYLIDQLRADLRARGIGSLPDAWQFVHVDVPLVAEGTESQLGNILSMGGRYVSFATPAGNYETAALNVEAKLGQGASANYAPLLGWAPRDKAKANGVPVKDGAGQYRAIGRMLTLSKLNDLHRGLLAAHSAAMSPTAWGEIPPADRGGDTVVPIIVGSMAGGSGASMFLDVARILGLVPNIDPASMGCFLYTADVFTSLPESQRTNVEGNAMGALSEIIAAIARSSDGFDKEALSAFGISSGYGDTPAFGRIIPVGLRVGGSGALFGDGRPSGVYRGIARALAAIMTSETASMQYIKGFLENPTPLMTTSERFGWKTNPSDLPFAGMGFSTLSLGRDRYLDYAAQRLSRSAVDHLVEGHEDPTSQLPGTEQLRILMDNQWAVSTQAIGLPSPGEAVPAWFQNVAFPRIQWEAAARDATEVIAASMGSTGSAPAGTWLATVQANAGTVRGAITGSVQRAAYTWAEQWAGQLERATKAEFLRVTSAFGLPYGRELMSRLRVQCDQVIGALAQAGSGATSIDPVAGDPGVQGQAQALGKQAIGAEHALAKIYRRGIQATTEKRLRLEAADLAARVLQSYASDVLGALETAANDALAGLEQARASAATPKAGLAQLHSTIYKDWPDESSRVPLRFDQAHNEVLLTTSEQFPQQFVADVAAAGGGSTYTEGIRVVRTEVLSGIWETAGARADHPVIDQVGHWRASVLTRDALSGQPTPPAKPKYVLALSPKDIVRRAAARLSSPGDVFERFSGQSIAEYLNDGSVAAVELDRRRGAFIDSFIKALALARPLVGVDPQMALRLHSIDMTYTYAFSEIPLDGASEVADGLRSYVTSAPDIDDQVTDSLDQAFQGDTSRAGKIAVFGGYPKISPLCYSSLLSSIKQRWAQSPQSFQRSLWLWKRTKPLAASLAMSPAEAERVVAGWYLGRLLGLVRQPDIGSPQVATTNGWVSVGPYLESEEAAVHGPMDVLAGVMMSHAWAIARCAGDPDLSPLIPFEAIREFADETQSTQAFVSTDQLRGTKLLAAAFRDQPLRSKEGVLPSDPLSPVLAGAGAAPPEGAISLAPPPPPGSVSGSPTRELVVARHAALVRWIEELQQFYLGQGYVRKGDDGVFRAHVTSMAAVVQAPLSAELAPVAMRALDLLRRMADAALDLDSGGPIDDKHHGGGIFV
ncbi:tubulin-like doman-containing protein [Janibacter sp. GXQ6167]|uniref:tubulin-like doman-containing protein n=1 Tax=Janibacter sp. GXQ6167 TaxID=3240791 RepID=UPI003524E814